MKRNEGRDATTGVELFPIRTVSTLTGVNSITLRAWERRYGLVQPIRTPTGHRLYRQDEIDLIHRVVALLEKGISISQVRRALERESQNEGWPEKPEDRLWLRLRQRMSTALIRLDEEALDQIYNEALGLAPVERVTQDLLLPLLRELGRRAEAGAGSPAEEAFFGMYLRNKLGARMHHRAHRSSCPRFLGACLPGEHRETELLLFALAAHEAGLSPVLLGANTPLAELAAAAQRGRCKAIVLSGSTATESRWLSEELPALCSAANVPVFIAGSVSLRHRDELVAAGAVPLGNDLANGTRRVAQALSATQPL